jgi:excisionase family DNA binding protein
MADNPDLLNVSEAAQYLRVSPMFIYRRTSRGTLQHFKVGSALRFSRGQLDKFLQASEVVPEPELAVAAR